MVTRDGVLLTWKGLSGIMTLVAVGAIVVAVQAQQRPGGATLSAQDYIDIQQLVARYPYALDGSLERGAVYADLFTADVSSSIRMAGTTVGARRSKVSAARVVIARRH
jgi:hypothetical protein